MSIHVWPSTEVIPTSTTQHIFWPRNIKESFCWQNYGLADDNDIDSNEDKDNILKKKKKNKKS